MHYITVAEFESPGTVTCNIQGLPEDERTKLVNAIRTMDINHSNVPHVFEIDMRGIEVLNTLSKSGFSYRVISQSTIIEISNIGGRTDKVQKTMWTLGQE